MKQDIGTLYKEYFEEYEVQPSKDCFNQIQGKLKKQHQYRIYKKVILFSGIGIAIVAAFLGGLSIINFNSENKITPIIGDKNISNRDSSETVILEKEEILKSLQSELKPIVLQPIYLDKHIYIQNQQSETLPLEQDSFMKSILKSGSGQNNNLDIQLSNMGFERLPVNEPIYRQNGTDTSVIIQNTNVDAPKNMNYPVIICTSDTLLCKNKPLLLFVKNAAKVEWSFGSIDDAVEVYPYENTIYEAYITTLSGHDTIITVNVQVEDCEIFVPSAFTPNGDGLNDVFKIETDMDFKAFELSIYTKSGKLMFTTYSQHAYWDGTYKGQALLQDIYIYIILYTDKLGKRHQQKGHFMLLR